MVSIQSVRKLFALGFTIIIFLFVFCSFSLIVFSVTELWHAVNPAFDSDMRSRFNFILESIGLLTIAVAALELAQTILDEEVRREVDMSSPTRIRRFLSRFMTVIIVSLSIEFLVEVFELIHTDPGKLPHAAAIGIATATLLAGWGIFLKYNKEAEHLEPEAMEKVKQEDNKLE